MKSIKSILGAALAALILRLSWEVYRRSRNYKLLDTTKAPSFTFSWLTHGGLATSDQISPWRISLLLQREFVSI